MTDLPAEVTTGKVVGRFRRAVVDSADADNQPDAQPEVGAVKFVPTQPYRRVLLPEPETIGSFSGIFELDTEGYLVDSQGARGLWLPTGTYDVSFAFKKTRISPVTIVVTEEHTELAPLDLSVTIPPAGSAALTPSQYAELSDRLSNLPTYVDAAVDDYLTANPPAGSGSTLTATDAPTAPAEGTSASYLVTSAVVWPAGLVWSTDPDGGEAPTITDTALVSLFTLNGETRAVMGATFPAAAAPPDSTAPTAGTLAGSAITDTGFTLTVTGASDETALHAEPYAFSTDNGATYSAWQASNVYAASGLTAETAYQCVHKVRDAALNEATGTAITVTTGAAAAQTLASRILAHSPSAYWLMDETTGATSLADATVNGRDLTVTGSLTFGVASGGTVGGTAISGWSPTNHAQRSSGVVGSSPAALTFLALIKTANTGVTQQIISRDETEGAGFREFQFRVTSTGNIGAILFNTSGAPTAASSTTVVSNTWLPVAMTWDGTTIRVYVGAAMTEEGSVAFAGPLDDNSTRQLTVGARYKGTETNEYLETFSGALDHVAVISGSALTQPQLAALFTGFGL